MSRHALARSLFTLAALQLAVTGCTSADRGPAPGTTAAAPRVDLAPAKHAVAADGVFDFKQDEGEPSAPAPRGQGAVATGSGAPAAEQAPKPREPTDAGARATAWTDAAVDRLSTFAADVDTASYTLARRALREGGLPAPASVRVEEFVNYFRYGYAAPAQGPFGVEVALAPSPLSANRTFARVGVTTKARSIVERKPANLVFLVDVSGSMRGPDRLDLARQSLRILTAGLGDGDQVAIVTYAGDTRVVLEPTTLEHKDRILEAIDGLRPGGGTAMGSGVELAYAQAARMLRAGTTTRVVILSDGDANIGRASHDEILATIAGKVREGITMSTIGFGMGNYRDELMEQLADRGNGNNYYVDGLAQARRVFQEQLGSTLEVAAKDVKLQVEFDPAKVARYRLVGYENRDVADADFRQDAVDGGELGAGHQVTAIYELELQPGASAAGALTVRIRHKQPDGAVATESTFGSERAAAARFDDADADFRFAVAIAAFADVLRGGEDAAGWSLRQVRAVAAAATGDDADRAEAVELMDRALGAADGRTALAR